MATIKLAEEFEQWASQFVDMQQFDGGEDRVQVNLTADQIGILIEHMDRGCTHTPEMIRLARLLNKAQMLLGHESLKNTYDVIKGYSRED